MTVQPTKKIGEFLSELVDNEELLRLYLFDRGFAAKEYGLTADQIRMLATSDHRTLKAAIEAEYAGTDTTVVFVMVIGSAPHLIISPTTPDHTDG